MAIAVEHPYTAKALEEMARSCDDSAQRWQQLGELESWRE
jgi:hypothetical protein